MTEIEYRDYILALRSGNSRISKKIARRLKAFLEMLPKEEKQKWQTKHQVDLSSIDALQRIRGVLVGREQQKEQIAKELQENHLLSLVGTAGVGKTHLALEGALLWREKKQRETVFCDASATNELLEFFSLR